MTTLNHDYGSLGLPNSWANMPCYSEFKNFLKKRGFTVYPTEFACYPSDHPMVDVAAKMGDRFWAFEYKSSGDSISRGVSQLRCYSAWFDYIVLVSEKELSHERSKNYWELRNLGAGLWNYMPGGVGKCVVRKDPVPQAPDRKYRGIVARRFRALTARRTKKPGASEERQLRLCEFSCREGR